MRVPISQASKAQGLVSKWKKIEGGIKEGANSSWMHDIKQKKKLRMPRKVRPSLVGIGA